MNNKNKGNSLAGFEDLNRILTTNFCQNLNLK
jgi:hypothetical protein